MFLRLFEWDPLRLPNKIMFTICSEHILGVTMAVHLVKFDETVAFHSIYIFLELSLLIPNK